MLSRILDKVARLVCRQGREGQETELKEIFLWKEGREHDMWRVGVVEPSESHSPLGNPKRRETTLVLV